jgi:hypothetical protein
MDTGKGGKAWKGIEQDDTAVMAKVGKTVFLTRKVVSKPTIMAKMIDINRDAIINVVALLLRCGTGRPTISTTYKWIFIHKLS